MAVALSAIAALGIAAELLLGRAEPRARDKIVSWLEAKFDSDVALSSLRLTIFPYPQAAGRGLSIRWKHRTDVPPMIEIDEFYAKLAWLDLLRPNWHVGKVSLKRFNLNIPPRSSKRKQPDSDGNKANSIVVDEIVTEQTMLRILPREAHKNPKEFELYHLRIRNAGVGRPMKYQAEMKNYKPPGVIRATGEFGPWMKTDPGLTPLSGDYTFSDADLGVFKGIAGILSSQGNFHGVLNRIDVQGTTDTPDFQLRMVGNPMALKTRYKAVVDGTNGTTVLQPVEAVLGQTPMTVEGGVFAEKGVKGKDIELHAKIQRGKFEDLLRLAVKGDAPMTGAISLDSTIGIPRGDVDVIDKLQLKGEVGVERMRFTNAEIQERIDELSRQGQGKPKAEDIRQVPSRLNTSFTLDNAVIDLPRITYLIEGAAAEARGQFNLRSQEMNFQGVLRLQARPSETMTGLKSWLMKPFDPLLSRGGRGTVLSFTVTGQRDKPNFGLDFEKTFKKTDR